MSSYMHIITEPNDRRTSSMSLKGYNEDIQHVTSMTMKNFMETKKNNLQPEPRKKLDTKPKVTLIKI